MAGTTPNLALYLPGGGSTGDYVPDEVADIDPLNANFVKIDTFAGSVGNPASQNRQFTGPAASIGTITGQKLGDEYQENDGKKILWRYDGANWVTYEPGSYLIRPTSIANSGGSAVINPDGTVSFTGTTSVSLNGVFTSRFREYEISWESNRVGGGVDNLRMRAAGADNSAASYVQRRIATTGSGYAEISFTSQQFDSFSSTYPTAYRTLRITNPVPVGWTRVTQGQGMDTDGGNLHATLLAFSGDHRVSASFDGFSLLASSGTATGKIRVLGFF